MTTFLVILCIVGYIIISWITSKILEATDPALDLPERILLGLLWPVVFAACIPVGIILGIWKGLDLLWEKIVHMARNANVRPGKKARIPEARSIKKTKANEGLANSR